MGFAGFGVQGIVSCKVVMTWFSSTVQCLMHFSKDCMRYSGFLEGSWRPTTSGTAMVPDRKG